MIECSKESRHKAIGVHSKFANLNSCISHIIFAILQILAQTKLTFNHAKMKTTNQLIITHLHNLPPLIVFSTSSSSFVKIQLSKYALLVVALHFPQLSSMTRARRKKALRQAQPFKARTAPRTLQRGNASERPDAFFGGWEWWHIMSGCCCFYPESYREHQAIYTYTIK